MASVMSVNCKKIFTVLLASSVLFLFGCKESPELEWTQERSSVTLSGQFITKSPDEIQFPVKVLFAIDCSLSMGQEIDGAQAGADPAFQRIDAVKSFINEYNVNDNVSFEIMLWSTSVFERTRNVEGDFGFTKNVVELNRVLDAVRNDTQTDYVGTLSEINKDIQVDMLLETDANNLQRTKYIVVFLSDGIANDNGRQSDTDIINEVGKIVDLTESAGVAGFNLHTFLLLGGFQPGDAGDEFRDQATTTLEDMAAEGGGEFTEFENAEAVNFLNLVDLRLSIEYLLKYIIAYNVNTIPGTEVIHLDTDGDGLSDEQEMDYGSNPTLRDSDNDGLSDYVEFTLSSPGNVFNPNTDPDTDAPDSNCSPVLGQWLDSDGDLLTDCEEELIGTDRLVVDTDGDGIPDGLEFLAGTNPFFAEDVVDTDYDGFANPIEIRNHTNVKSNDPKLRARYSYNYQLIDRGKLRIEQGTNEGTIQSVRRLFTLDISNIDIMETGRNPVTAEYYQYSTDPNGVADKYYAYDADYPDYTQDYGDAASNRELQELGPGDNVIQLFVAQVPSDKPYDPPIFSKVEFIVNVNDSSEQKQLEFHSEELVNQASLSSIALTKLD